MLWHDEVSGDEKGKEICVVKQVTIDFSKLVTTKAIKETGDKKRVIYIYSVYNLCVCLSIL